ncbi:hypothetical protein TYRP_015476, partial [Tyrophagus putrescentiae]
RLTEGEQSFGIVGEQMHLKVGILGEYGQVWNFGVIVPVKSKLLKSSQTVDGGDQFTSQLAVHSICSVHHQVGQLALPVGMLQKGHQSVNVLTAVGHEFQTGDGREDVDNLLDGGSVDQL